MVHFPAVESLEGRLSDRLVTLLDEARCAIDTDLDAALAYVTRAVTLIGQDRDGMPGGHTRPGDDRIALERGGLAPWQMTRLVHFIDGHLESCTSNQALAGQAGLSRSYFSKAFRRSFGQSPHNYVIARRVERAKMLMQTTPDPLSQIASACGFSDQAHLARVFRRLIGQAPNLWRRQSRQDGSSMPSRRRTH